LCVSYARSTRSSLEVETENEDQVYEIKFDLHFGKGEKKLNFVWIIIKLINDRQLYPQLLEGEK
jgi:hypothetical protein